MQRSAVVGWVGDIQATHDFGYRALASLLNSCKPPAVFVVACLFFFLFSIFAGCPCLSRRWLLSISSFRSSLQPACPLCSACCSTLAVRSIDCRIGRSRQGPDASLTAVTTMLKMMKNMTLKSKEDKFKRIRLGNPNFNAKVGGIDGGIEVSDREPSGPSFGVRCVSSPCCSLSGATNKIRTLPIYLARRWPAPREDARRAFV